MRRESSFGLAAKCKDLLPFVSQRLGQNCPQQCPYPEDDRPDTFCEPLGEPLSIRQVACLIGCSTWTVRQRYVPAGLPHLRLGPNGKLIFYKTQIIHWLLRQQQKGGSIA
jgi:hypothetical protein